MRRELQGKLILKKILIIVLMVIMLLVFTGCEESETKEDLLKEKTLVELEYVETDIFSIIQKYLTGEYLEDDLIDWNEIKYDFQEVANNNSSIILDLTDLQIENDQILEFGNRINAVNSAIENEFETSIVESLMNLYKLIPYYLEKIYPENRVLYLEKNVKSYLFESLYYCMVDDFETGLNLLESAETMYQELMNNSEYLEENSYNSNKTFVAIQEMKLAVQNQESENVILKYVNINF